MPAPRTSAGAKNIPAANTDPSNKKKTGAKSEGLLTKVLLVVIILLLLSLPLLIIKFDVRGMGQKVRPLLEDIPYVQKVLPPKPDPTDPKFMNKKELTESFLSYKEQFEQLSLESNSLKKELELLSNVEQNYEQFQKDQDKLEEEKVKLQQERQQLEADKNSFFQDIADEKKTDFKAYFEKIHKEEAQQLYKEILEDEKIDQQIKEYVSFYENMDAENAAKIFDEMSTSKMDLIVSILKNMNREQAAEILAAMNITNAAKASDILSKEYPISVPKE
ncbi:MAG: MotE family protein [Clostridia bacterium]